MLEPINIKHAMKLISKLIRTNKLSLKALFLYCSVLWVGRRNMGKLFKKIKERNQLVCKDCVFGIANRTIFYS